MPRRLVLIDAALALLILAPLGCTSDTADADAVTFPDGAGGTEGSDGGTGNAVGSVKVTNTTVSGLVKDEYTGKPVQDAKITTVPPTESVATNAQGQYVINVGRAFGVLTVQASKAGWVQSFSSCVNLKPGINNLGDVSMVRTSGPALPDSCDPPCGATTRCISGVCVTACDAPACACTERCAVGGICEPDPNVPSTGVCGVNSHPLGGGVCECDTGFVPAGDGASCALPSALTQCPDGAELSPDGCVCRKGLIPDATGSACVLPDDALVVAAISDGTVVREWPTPGPAPRGAAFDGQTLWVGDAATRRLDRIAISSGEVAASYDLGDRAPYLVDLAAVDAGIVLAYAGTPAAPSTPVLERLDPASGLITPLAPNGLATTLGLTYDGTDLLTLEGLVLKRRTRDLAQSLGPIDVLLDPALAGTTYVTRPESLVRLLAYTQGQTLGWVGTAVDSAGLRTELIALNAVHPTKATEIGRLSLYVGASHITGLEAFGDTLWLVAAGTGASALPGGVAPPKIVEVQLD